MSEYYTDPRMHTINNKRKEKKKEVCHIVDPRLRNVATSPMLLALLSYACTAVLQHGFLFAVYN